jgi:DNA-binding response OmpR family regulator
MENANGRMLVVDDDFLNRTLLATNLEEEGFAVETAEDGRQALDTLRAEKFDVVLLDILMPEMDGYQVLQAIKSDGSLKHLPVIVISAVDEMESVVRCIEMGATDYLPKPFEPALLRARLNASLAAKRLRDLELEYLVQVGHVIGAAGAVEAGTFESAALDGVAKREDALGQLARVFQKMAQGVVARENKLKKQIQELKIEIDQSKQAKKVAEITDSDYFKSLRGQANDLRSIIEGNTEIQDSE